MVSFFFLATTGFYLYQHSTGFSWDFAVYALNAKYFFGGYYFEWARPPLASLVMAALGFFGWLIAEYIYIIAVSALHLYSSRKFADAYKLDRKAFYIFSLTPFSVLYAFSAGTELFSVALLQLFLISLTVPRSGILFGLASLLRYSNFIYIFLIAFQKNLRKINLSLVFMAAVFTPWLLYNWYVTGDPLTSIADFYALNFYFRSLNYPSESFNIFDVLIAWNMLLPFFVFAAIKLIASKKVSRNDFIMLVFLVLTVLSYSLAVFKEPRFLYASSIPLAYFAAKLMGKYRQVIYCFAIISLLSVLFLPYTLENPSLYKHLSSGEKCAAQSNVWVPLNYYGLPAEPFPYMEDINASIESGYRIILLKHVGDPAYVKNTSFLGQFKIIENNSVYIILGDKSKCKEASKIDKTFLGRQNTFYNSRGKPLNLTSCKILFPFLCR